MAQTSTLLDPPDSPSLMLSSTSSLSSSRHQSPSIARIYKSASQLFLTRRIQEALEAIEPVINPPDSNSNGTANGELYTNGHANGDPHGEVSVDITPPQALIATASRGARIKIWNLYVSILNEIVEMGPDEGKAAFGAVRWKALVKHVRDGTVWDEVISKGYGGVEGLVDAEVITNLATLMLAHAPSQKPTQARLETYLSSTSQPNLDITSHLEASQRRATSPARSANGTSTPRDLTSRLKLLEIYTLHVLPRNNEWDYASEFINMSEVLDEDRKEAFQTALQAVREQTSLEGRREAELARQREEQIVAKRKEEEDQRKREEEAKRPRSSNERDYGVENTQVNGSSNDSPTSKPQPTVGAKKAANGHAKANASSASASASTSRPSASTRPTKKPPSRVPPPATSLYRLTTQTIAAIQNVLLQFGQNMSRQPAVVLRMLLFFVALILALGRRDVRERVRRIANEAWESLRRTVGMGVKVSYI